jgi:prophage antirepressor-like protein
MQQTTTLQPFTFAAGMTIRALRTHEGDPWFIATDIAQALGYRNAPDMTRLLDADEADKHNLRSRSANGVEQSRTVTIISESGLYSAIFSSSKPEAKAFKKWVTGTVLPSLRKHGAYAVGAENLPPEAQDALYSLYRGQLREAMRRHDNETAHDHWSSRSKVAARSKAAALRIAGEMGLPLSAVAMVASQGVDVALTQLTKPV